MKRILAAAVLALTMGACTSANAVHLIAANQLPPDLFGKQKPVGGAHTQQVIVYFIRGNRLVQVARSGSSALSGAELVMRQLLAGPSAEEQADGLSSAIPPDTALLFVRVEPNHVATVNLSQEFEQAAEPRVQQIRLAQVVYSLTELQDVDSVRFEFEGDVTPVLDQNGVPAPVVSRGRYSRFQPEEPLTPVDPCTLVESLGSCPQTATAG